MYHWFQWTDVHINFIWSFSGFHYILLRQTFLLSLVSFYNFIILNSSPRYCTSFKMLSCFLNYFKALLMLANPLNEEFCLYLLCNFLIILTHPSTILLHIFLLFPLRYPSVVLHAMGGSSTTLLTWSSGTGWHGLPTTTVGGHCHLPHIDRLPTLPMEPIEPEIVERLSFFITISYACTKNCLEQ